MFSGQFELWHPMKFGTTKVKLKQRENFTFFQSIGVVSLRDVTFDLRPGRLVKERLQNPGRFTTLQWYGCARDIPAGHSRDYYFFCQAVFSLFCFLSFQYHPHHPNPPRKQVPPNPRNQFRYQKGEGTQQTIYEMQNLIINTR